MLYECKAELMENTFKASSHSKLLCRIKMKLATDNKCLNQFIKNFISFVVISSKLLWALSRSSCRPAGNMRNREERKGTEQGESMDVEHAYLGFFNLAFSMSAQQSTAFCFELGRNQTMSSQRRELPTTLESFTGL